MKIAKYQDFIVIAHNVALQVSGGGHFDVQIFTPPAELTTPVRQRLPPELRHIQQRLEQRQMNEKEIIDFGKMLASVLLPPPELAHLLQLRDRLGVDEALRIRLRLPPSLAHFPWEYMYVQHPRGMDDTTGFLALDPRVSIVRHEGLSWPRIMDTKPRTRHLLLALANSDSEPKLNLDCERKNIEDALQGISGIQLDVVEDCTLTTLLTRMVQMKSVDIFHFAGHGEFVHVSPGQVFESYQGESSIALEHDGGEHSQDITADQLAINLRNHGVQLAVLNACYTGKRDQEQAWGAMVTALMEAQIPAAIAMQFQINDMSAVAFSHGFYRALAAGWTLEQAITMGRLAVFNRWHRRGDPTQSTDNWCDWGVPVLYQQTDQMVVLPSIADGAERNRLSTTLEADAQHRLKQLHPADRLDWLWNLFSIIILIIAASFAIETAQRFLTENPGAAGTLSVLAQAVISMAAAGSLLTKRGDEAIVRIMEMLAIPVYRRREVRLGVSVLLLAFTFGFFLALKPIATIYNDVGLQYHERQEYVAAQYAYRLAISLRPDYPAAHYNLGSLHEDLLDMEQAETEYVLAVQGGYLSARNNLARLYLLSGNPAKAVALLGPEHSLPHPTHPATGQSQPENSVVRQRALLADADEARTGQPDESAKLSSNLWKNLGWARLQLEQYDLALYCLEKAIDANPNNVSANCLFAQSYMATGQEATASPYWRACLAAENEPYQNRPELDPLLRMASDYFMRKGE